MSVFIDKSTRLIVQGLTGREGTFHAKAAAAYGTTVVGGVTPGKGGTTHEEWQVFDTVQDAVVSHMTVSPSDQGWLETRSGLVARSFSASNGARLSSGSVPTMDSAVWPMTSDFRPDR